MGLFDALKRTAESTIKTQASKAVNNAVNNAVTNVGNAVSGKNRCEKFSFSALPTTVDELKALPEASLDSPFKSAALAIVALTRFESDPQASYAMLDFLKGPAPLNPMEKQFIRDRLNGKCYKVFSFFDGATPENSYTPNTPYTIAVSENPYSYPQEDRATLYVKSGGADSVRPIMLRKKPSTGQWFVTEIQCLSDIRLPVDKDPWA